MVLTPRRWRQVGERNFTGDGGKQARSPGRARRKPLKPSRAGMPGDPGATVVTNSCAFYFCTRGCGCVGHPAFPTPSGVEDKCKTRAHRAAGTRRHVHLLSSLRAKPSNPWHSQWKNELRRRIRSLARTAWMLDRLISSASRYSGFFPNCACGRPKSGAAESWPISTMPRRMARVRVKCSNSASPSPRRMARVSLERSSLKVPSISSTASLLARNTSRHMVGSEAAMRVKSRKPPAENFITSDCVTPSSSSAVPTMV